MIEPYSSDLVWLIVAGFAIAFVLAFGIGANDVANSFGTSVGSKVLTIVQACCLATVFEIAGSILIGYKVSDTMRKGILDVRVYEDSETELMFGSLSTLTSSAVWLLAATFLKLPISGTHSIVGASIGFSLVARGTAGLHWKTLGTIVGSWFVSPLLSGVASSTIFLLIKRTILVRDDPLEAGLTALPWFYGFAVFVNVFSIVHDGPKLLHMDNIPVWLATVVSGAVAIVTAILVRLLMVPWQRRKIVIDEASANARKAQVNFDIGDDGSTDTSPEGSPQKSIRRNSQTKAAICESTELKSLEYVFLPPADGDRINNGYTPAKETREITNETTLSMATDQEAIDGAMVRSTESAVTIAATETGTTRALSPNSSAVPLIAAAANDKRSRSDAEADGKLTNRAPDGGDDDDRIDGDGSASKLFSFLQVLTAMFGSFAHGGNDVSNAIGPLIALWLIYTEGSVQQKSETPLYILLYGGFGISVGLWLWGRRVIQTIGEDLTTITPSTGFTIEIGAAFTVLLASKIGLPISTTHCKVGSVVFVGYFSATRKGVDWTLFRNIIYAWIVTVPVTALLSAAFMYALKRIFL